MKKEFPYKVIRKRDVYQGANLSLIEETIVQSDGTVSNRPIVTRKDGSNIVPVTLTGKVVMIEEYRYNCGKVLTLPGGGIDPGETPMDAAGRELREETGYITYSLERLFLDNGSGTIKHNRYVFLGRGARMIGSPKPAEDETIVGVREIDLEDAVKMAMGNEFPAWTFKALILARGRLLGNQ